MIFSASFVLKSGTVSSYGSSIMALYVILLVGACRIPVVYGAVPSTNNTL